MALSIKNKRAEELARAVAEAAHETQTQAVITALEERLVRLEGRRGSQDVFTSIMEIAGHCSGLPDLTDRSADDILGYGSAGTFRD